MKKIYTVVACALLTLGMSAQSIQSVPNGARVPQGVDRSNPPTTQSTMSFYTDYDYMDETYNVDSLGGLYARYIWDMNMNYDLTMGDTALTYAVVDFSSFWDSYNANGPTPVPTPTFTTYSIDSVFILGGHSNYSGQPDTIVIVTIGLNGGGYPQNNTVLDRDTLIATNFGAVNSFLQAAVIGVEVNHQITTATTRFAIRVEYYGDRTLDTFGILAGFGDLGPGNCPTNSNLPNFALPSHHALNSYRYDQRFSPQYGMLPTAANLDTYYECNGTAGKQAGLDSEHFLQNWGIWAKITLQNVGIDELGTSAISLDQNMPNPANDGTTIKYSLAGNGNNVTLEVYDVTGQLIESIDQGSRAAGQHTIDLNTMNYAAGVYFYTLNVDGVKVTKKMVIGE